MEINQATEHLQVIRTLMERAALYRRTLAPIMLCIGTLGLLASAGGIVLGIEKTRTFCEWWLAGALVALTSAFLIARRQAFRDREPFWSPPTRRVTQALLPPLAAGFFFSLALVILNPGNMHWLFLFPNIFFYGCAMHAAGFFMPRGMKLFGWLIIVLAGFASLVLLLVRKDLNPRQAHVLMGVFFGFLHLGYGVYLRLTEVHRNET